MQPCRRSAGSALRTSHYSLPSPPPHSYAKPPPPHSYPGQPLPLGQVQPPFPATKNTYRERGVHHHLVIHCEHVVLLAGGVVLPLPYIVQRLADGLAHVPGELSLFNRLDRTCERVQLDTAAISHNGSVRERRTHGVGHPAGGERVHAPRTDKECDAA